MVGHLRAPNQTRKAALCQDKSSSFQTPTPPSSSEIQTLTYTPAQTNSVQTTQPTLNINTIHSNPSSNYTTARQLSRPPLQPLLTNPLSYNLTSTNPSHTQQSQINTTN